MAFQSVESLFDNCHDERKFVLQADSAAIDGDVEERERNFDDCLASVLQVVEVAQHFENRKNLFGLACEDEVFGIEVI